MSSRTIIQDYDKYLSKVDPEKGRKKAQAQEAKWAEQRKKREQEKLTEAYQKELRARTEQAARERRKVEKATAAFNASSAAHGTKSNTPDKRQLREIRESSRREIPALKNTREVVNRRYGIGENPNYSNYGYAYKTHELSDEDKVKQWINPDYKLSDKEKKEARDILKREKERRNNVIKQGSIDAIIPGTEEYNRLQQYNDLEAKTKGEFARGALLPFLKVSNLAQKGIGKLLGDSDNAQAARNIWDEQMQNAFRQDRLSAAQSPIKHGAGNFAGTAAMYSATNPLFDAAAEGLGITSAAGKFIVNQLAQNAQDLAIDTAPERQMMRDMGMSEDEINRETLKNVRNNALGNLAMPVLGKLASTAVDAFKGNLPQLGDSLPKVDMDEVRQGIAKLQGINNNALTPERQTIEALEDTTKQIEDTVQSQKAIGKAKKQSFTDEKGNLHRYEQLYDSPELTEVEIYKDKNNKWRVGQHWENMGADRDIDRFDDLLKDSEDRAMSFDTKEDAVKEFEKRLKTRKYSDYVPEFNPDEALPFSSNVNAGDSAPDIKQIEDAVQKQTAEAQKVLKEAEPIEEWTQNTLKKGMYDFPEDYSNAYNEMQQIVDQVDVTDPDLDFTSLVHDIYDVYSKYSDTPEAPEIKKLAVQMINDTDAAYKAGGWPKEPTPIEKAIGSIGDVRGMVDEAEARNADKLWETATNNIKRVRDAADNLEDAIKNGASTKEIEPLYKEYEKAYGALDKNLQKIGDKSLSKRRKEIFGKNDTQNVMDIVRNADTEPDLRIDEDGYIIPSESDDFSIMNEDTGINGKFNIIDDDAPEIRMDASTPESINAGDDIIPPTDVERLTREPNQLVDNTRERSFHASAAERGAIPDDIKEALRQQDSIDRNTYVQQKNWQTEDEAIRLWEQINTFDEAEAQYKQLLSEMNPAATPFARRLVSAYSKNGNREAAMNVMDRLAEAGTKSGRFSQSMILGLAKDDPLTALRYAERQINKINETGRKEFGKKWKDFNLTDEEKALFDKITPGDEDAIKAAMDKIGERIGKEYPTKVLSKVLEVRRLAMLFNIRTNIRNFGANIPTLGMRWTADRVDAIGQNIAHLINPDFEVTQAVTGSGLKGRKIAKEIFESKRVQDLLDGAGSKYEDNGIKNSLLKNKTMFKGNFVEHWIDDVTGGGIEKIAKLLGKDIKVDGGIQAFNKKAFGKSGTRSFLETFRNATYKMLDIGDSPFVRENFIERLGSYIRAQGITDMKDVPDEAIQLAYEEAMKATYKDNSWGYQMVKGARDVFNKIPVVGKPLGEAVIPFVQAPGNIAARMVDYSPIRGTKGLVDVIRGAKGSDEALVKRGIEEVSKGLTGTAAVYAGMKLYESGLITGSYSKDKDQREFEKQHGFREWSVRVPGKNGGKDKYIQFDWAQPAAEPLLVGALIQDAITKSDEYDSDILKALGIEGSTAGKIIGGTQAGAGAALNSWFNASPIQNLQDFMGGGEYYSTPDSNGVEGIAKNIKDTAINSFATSFAPAQMGAIAKSVDPIQRNTNDPTNGAKTLVNQFMSKIPYLSEKLPAKYDTWGREMKTADTQGGAFVARNLSPGELTTDTSTPLDKEISRLGEVSTSAFPPVADKKAGDMKLDNKEMSAQQKDMGQRNYELADAFIKSESYKGMSDEDRVKTLSDLYSMSKAITNEKLFKKEISNSGDRKNADVYNKVGADGFIEYLGMKKSLPSKGTDAAAVAMLSKLPEEKQDQMLPLLVDTEGSKEKSEMWEKAGNDGSNFINQYQKAQRQKAKKERQKQAKKELEAAEMNMTVDKVKDVQAELASYGANDSKTTVKYYTHAKETIPSLTPKGYANKLHEIGGDDYKITQKEMLAYANNKNLSQEDMTRYWNAFGEWKRQPRLSNGTWKAGK